VNVRSKGQQSIVSFDFLLKTLLTSPEGNCIHGYRFRAPNLIYLKASFEHSIWGRLDSLQTGMRAKLNRHEAILALITSGTALRLA
jgi:hypothetical protein